MKDLVARMRALWGIEQGSLTAAEFAQFDALCDEIEAEWKRLGDERAAEAKYCVCCGAELYIEFVDAARRYFDFYKHHEIDSCVFDNDWKAAAKAYRRLTSTEGG